VSLARKDRGYIRVQWTGWPVGVRDDRLGNRPMAMGGRFKVEERERYSMRVR
jgi:hypothetical protein